MQAQGTLWTAAEISSRLGLSTAIYQTFRLGAEHIAAIRRAGITRIELSLIQGCLDYRDQSQTAEILDACRSEGVTVVSVHGPFKLPYGSADEAARKTVVEESLAAIRFAREMGASVYVAHFGFKEHSEKTAAELLRQTEDSGIVLTSENQVGQNLQPYIDVVDAVDSDRYGMIVDIGHNRDGDGINPFVKKDRARQTLAQCGHRLRHIHLHETFDLEQKPDHWPPLHPDGIIEWGEIFAALKEIGYSGELVFEDGRGEDPEQWTRMTAAFPQAFVRKYNQRRGGQSRVVAHHPGGIQVNHRGLHEIELKASSKLNNPYFDLELRITFTRPDGSEVTVDGFYDGAGLFKARAYCDTVGSWRWRSVSGVTEMDGQTGVFEVVPSSHKGKLRKHSEDSRQFAYDNGDWFLHIGDTGYRYVTDTEPEWQAYIDQAAQAGFTKVRTWFCRGRSDVQVLFAEDRTALNLPYWQEIDRRLTYALEHHPHVIFKLIPYGEDTEEINRYAADDPASTLIARYAQARFSAFPNVIWCISNDREIVTHNQLEGRRVHYDTICKMGRDMAAREPWGTLLTNHQCRFKGYSFVDEPWSDIITLEDLDQVGGEIILEYRKKGNDPVINDEDRYEAYRNPQHNRYFNRRLMWASLLSGGHATYGGLRTFEPYDRNLKGVQGYYDAIETGKLDHGADDFIHIHSFFFDADLTLVGLTPDDACVGDDPLKWKCIRSSNTFIIYIANPSGDTPKTDHVADTVPEITVHLPDGNYTVEWFKPTSGAWTRSSMCGGGNSALVAPDAGDWVLLLRQK